MNRRTDVAGDQAPQGPAVAVGSPPQADLSSLRSHPAAARRGPTLTPSPLRAIVAQVDGIGRLGVAALGSVVRPRGPYAATAAMQFLFGLRLALLPVVVASFALGFGPIGVQLGGLELARGDPDRIGAFIGLLSTREIAPNVVGLVLAGVVGARMCADLGAARLRGEVTSLRLLGADPVTALVVPRLVALIALAPLLAIAAQQVCVAAGAFACVLYDVPFGSYSASLFGGPSGPSGTAVMLVRSAVYGVVVAVVACYRGLTAAGDAGGIARGVTGAIVISLLAVAVLNVLVVQTIEGANPQLQVVK